MENPSINGWWLGVPPWIGKLQMNQWIMIDMCSWWTYWWLWFIQSNVFWHLTRPKMIKQLSNIHYLRDHPSNKLFNQCIVFVLFFWATPKNVSFGCPKWQLVSFVKDTYTYLVLLLKRKQLRITTWEPHTRFSRTSQQYRFSGWISYLDLLLVSSCICMCIPVVEESVLSAQ